MKTINWIVAGNRTNSIVGKKIAVSGLCVILGRQYVLAHFLPAIVKRGQSSVKSGRLLTATLMPFDDS